MIEQLEEEGIEKLITILRSSDEKQILKIQIEAWVNEYKLRSRVWADSTR